MTGKMDKRKGRFGKGQSGAAKSFHAPQKPNSKRAKRRAALNYEDQREGNKNDTGEL